MAVKDVRPAAGRSRRLAAVQWWAALGVLFLILQVYTVAAWMLRGEATPTPRGLTPIPTSHVITVWAVEIVCTAVAFFTLYHFVFKPWRRTGRIDADAMLVLVCANLYFWDPVLNWRRPFILYSSQAANVGSWTSAYPGGSPNAHLLPEPLLIIGAAFVWFFFGVAVLASAAMRWAKRRWPRINAVGLVAIACVVGLFADLIAESIFLQTGVYAYPRTGWLTLFPNAVTRFPLYESIFIGVVCGALACIRYFRNDRGEMLSERGLSQLSPSAKHKNWTRFLALLGAANAAFFVVYAIPIQFASLTIDQFHPGITDKSYFVNGLCPVPDSRFPCAAR
jgi:Spirocyclase AveC-like